MQLGASSDEKRQILRTRTQYRNRGQTQVATPGRESCLMTDDAFIKTMEQETARQAAMLNGDPGP